jgi:uncharacterized protein YaeQ
MALPSVLHHLDLRFSHAERGVDGDVSVKLARHPSETMDRLWLRIIAFAWKWREGIAFGPGLCEPDAPDLRASLPDGRASLVVRVGKPEPARVERDVNQNAGAEVAVLFEAPRRLDAFLAEARERRLARAASADLAAVDPPLIAALAGSEQRRIRAAVTIVADHLYVDVDGRTLDGPLHRGASR